MECNARFAERSYWDDRFDTEAEYEWFSLNYNDLLPTLRNLGVFHESKGDVDVADEGYFKSILMLGTGNSRLPIEMAIPHANENGRGGFLHITSMDFSNVALQHMKQQVNNNDKLPDQIDSRLEWLVADLRALPFKPNSYEFVIEKGTLDVFFVGEKDPWRISKETTETVNSIMNKIWDILPVGGVFLSISFAQPHFRLPFFAGNGLKWNVAFHPIRGKCSEFDYYAYTATKTSERSDGNGVFEAVDKLLKRPSRTNGAEVMRLANDDDMDAHYLTKFGDSLFSST